MTEKSFVKNAADPKQVKDASLKEKFGREQEINDVLFVLSDVRGRRFLWRILGKAGIDRQRFDGDVNWGLFNDGRASLGLLVKADIVEANPTALITMMVEAKNRQANEQEPKPKENQDE